MNFQNVATLLLILFSLRLRNHGTQGGRPTIEQEFAVDGRLEIINGESRLDIFEDEEDNVFECVNIYKQPAFTNPLLKDHQIQMKPSFVPELVLTETPTNYEQVNLSLETMNCPEGMVPIRKAQQEDLNVSKPLRNAYSQVPLGLDNIGQHFAVLHQSGGPRQVFYGSQAIFNIVNPNVGDDQASLALISLRNGTNGDENIIQAGWGVAPQLYGDHKTHFITYWRRGKSGCYNVICPGFVQTDKNHPVDTVLRTSIPDHVQLTLVLSVQQDQVSKNWWLRIPSKSINIGYWPNSLLPGLSNGATIISWGGHTSDSANGISLPMGYGKYPDGSFIRSAYFRDIQLIDESHRFKAPGGILKTYVDKPGCYQIKNYGLTLELGYAMQFGGPGGMCGK